MSTQRVWLSGWEWGCCGNPFHVGDTVTFMVDRPVDAWLVDQLGPQLAETVDAVESHHEDGGAERLIGTVLAIHAVAVEYERRRAARSAHGEPTRDASPDVVAMPGSVAMRGLRSSRRWESSQGWAAVGGAAAGPAPAAAREPIAGSAILVPLSAVPWPPREIVGEKAVGQEGELAGGAAIPGRVGYLVDLRRGGGISG